MILGRKLTRESLNSGEDFFFRDHIIFGAEIKNSSSSAPRLKKVSIPCHGQNNAIFRKSLNFKTKTRNLSPILGKDFFF